MKTRMLIVVVLGVVIAATALWSQGPPPPGGPGHGPGMASPAMAVMPPKADMVDGITKALSLTTDQAAKLNEILAESDAVIQPLVKAVADKCKALREGLPDGTNVDALLKEATDAESALIAACLDTWATIRSDSGLTADQLAKLVQPPCGPPPPGGPPPGGPPPGGTSSGNTTRR